MEYGLSDLKNEDLQNIDGGLGIVGSLICGGVAGAVVVGGVILICEIVKG